MSNDPAIQALMGLRDDVYPCREDVPADLWGKPIVKNTGVTMTSPLYDSVWNPWKQTYKNTFINVKIKMEDVNYVQAQTSELTKSENRDNKSETVLRNTRGE